MKLDKIRNERIKGTTKVGASQIKSREGVEVVWACDEKRGVVGRKDGDGNESTGEKEKRKA